MPSSFLPSARLRLFIRFPGIPAQTSLTGFSFFGCSSFFLSCHPRSSVIISKYRSRLRSTEVISPRSISLSSTMYMPGSSDSLSIEYIAYFRFSGISLSVLNGVTAQIYGYAPISCAENLIKHQCHRITDPFRCSRKYHFHHQFIAI